MGLSLKERIDPRMIAPCDGGEVLMYRVGVFSMSVCAPGHLDGPAVAHAINQHYPCGTLHGWQISSDTAFRTGEPNPCQCEEDPDRKHWLIDC